MTAIDWTQSPFGLLSPTPNRYVAEEQSKPQVLAIVLVAILERQAITTAFDIVKVERVYHTSACVFASQVPILYSNLDSHCLSKEYVTAWLPRCMGSAVPYGERLSSLSQVGVLSTHNVSMEHRHS